MSNFFRREVIAKQSQKLFGDVILASPISHIAITGLLVTIISGLILFTISVDYSRKERVAGYLTPDKGIIRIVPSQAGVIENIDVKFGDNVIKGDRLFSIKTDYVSGSGFDIAKTLLNHLEREKTELQKRYNLIPEQYRLTRSRLVGQISASKAEAVRLNAQVELQKRSVQNEQEVFLKFQALLRDEAASKLEASSQENRVLQASQSLEKLWNEKLHAIEKSVDLQAEYDLLPVTEKRQISEVTSQLIAIDQRITQTKAQEKYIINAPISGRLASLTAREGQIADPQRAIASILPIDGKLEAILLVPSRAAGFVKEGQSVRLLYDAFPYQKFGTHSGIVSNVSRTVISATDLQINFSIDEPVFIITVDLKEQNIQANNDLYALQSGMTLAADIILEDRKLWEWAFAPFLGTSKN